MSPISEMITNSVWKKKGYILASVIFYHNILHRLKVLAPKHWWKITLSSRAARQKKFHKKELFLKSSTEVGIQASSHWREHAGVTQQFRHISEIPIQPQYSEFYCQWRNPPFFPLPNCCSYWGNIVETEKRVFSSSSNSKEDWAMVI